MPVKKSKRRSRNKQQTFRGLPSHELLIELAKTYLKIQRSHAKALGVTVPKATKQTPDQKRNRGRWQQLNAEEVAKAGLMLAAGANVSDVVEQTTLSASTIYRLRRKQHSSRDRSGPSDTLPMSV